MIRTWRTLFGSALLMAALWSTAGAVPNLLNYQGRLTDAAGTPVNGANSVVFSLFAAPTGGAALWTETQNVTAANGIFSVLLGSVTAFPGTLFSGADLYLAIKVGADAEMTPRQRIASVAYAMRSGTTDTPTIVRWANVKADGTIQAQSGGINVTHSGPGVYQVDSPTTDESATGIVVSSYNSPGAGSQFAPVTYFANSASGAFVITYNTAFGAADHDFSIMFVPTTGLVPPVPPAAASKAVEYDEHNLPVRK